jgi:L-ascorbate metabolism protein UlaG (beta-lactamase superfamily)
MVSRHERRLLPAHVIVGSAVIVVLLLAAFRPTQPQGDGVAVTFLANEGVMLSSGSAKVLIDALFLKYERGYAVPADSTQAALQRARSPFDSIDLVLVTHRHGDHFHPAPVAAHLRANPQATLVTSQQVIDSLRRYAPARALSAERLMARTMRPGTRRREVIAGIAVELLGLPHGGHPRVEHVGYIVELGGRRVLHVGDSDFSEETLAPLRLDTARIDVALLPYWAVTSRKDRRVIERWIRPRRIVAFHIGDRDAAKAVRDVRRAMPNAVTLVRSLETRTW